MPVGQASNCWFGNPKGDRFRIHFHRQATGRPDAVDSSRDSSESLSVKGRLVQYAGRLHRSHEAKTEVLIHDYLDATPLPARCRYVLTASSASNEHDSVVSIRPPDGHALTRPLRLNALTNNR